METPHGDKCSCHVLSMTVARDTGTVSISRNDAGVNCLFHNIDAIFCDGFVSLLTPFG